MAEVGTSTPTKIYVGEYISWTRLETDFDPADGWTAYFKLTNSSNTETIQATDNGDGKFLFTADSTVTGNWTAADYDYWISVVKGSERYIVERGTITVHPNLGAGVVDARTHAKKMLDALEAMLEGTASKDQASMSVSTPGGSMSLSRLSVEEKIRWRDYYRREVAREKRQELIAQGKAAKTNIRVTF